MASGTLETQTLERNADSVEGQAQGNTRTADYYQAKIHREMEQALLPVDAPKAAINAVARELELRIDAILRDTHWKAGIQFEKDIGNLARTARLRAKDEGKPLRRAQARGEVLSKKSEEGAAEENKK